jgi:hypothetical protein
MVPGRFRFPYRALAGIALLLLGFAGPLQATQVRSLNLEQISARAATIFTGVCADVRVEMDPNAGWVSVVTFDVARSVKGRLGKKATVRFLGGQRDLEPRSPEIAGMQRFRRGDEVVLFLYGTSAIGLTSPVGFGQGSFHVVRDKRGKKLAINAFGNERLLDGVASSTRGRLGEVDSRSPGAKGIEVDALLDVATSLAK